MARYREERYWHRKTGGQFVTPPPPGWTRPVEDTPTPSTPTPPVQAVERRRRIRDIFILR